MSPSETRHVNSWIVTAAVMLATFMEILDTTLVNVSVPHRAGNLGATVEEGTWVVTSYLVSNAIILPVSGWLANRIGRRNRLLAWVYRFHIYLRVVRHGHQPGLPHLPPRAPRPYRRRITAPRARPSCSRPSRHSSMAPPWLPSDSASSSLPSSAPRSAAGSPTIIPGAGSFISIFRLA